MSLESTKPVQAAPLVSAATSDDQSHVSPAGIGDARLLLLGAPFLLAALAWLYAPTISWLWKSWQSDEYYAHGPLLPLIALYLMWQKRAELVVAWRGRPQKLGFPAGLIYVALVLQFLGTLVDMNIVRALQAFSIPLLLLGIARYIGGKAFARELRFALFFLCLAVPLSGPLVETLTVPLQNYAANGASICLGLLGIAVERVGVNLYTPHFHFVVAVPCSGLKTSITLLTMGVLIAHLMPNLSRAQRFVLCALSVPFALLANTLRVVAIVAIGVRHGQEAAEGFLHNFSGMLLFAIALGLLFLTGHMMSRARLQDEPSAEHDALEQDVAATDVAANSASASLLPPRSGGRNPLLQKMMVLIAMLLATRAAILATPEDVSKTRHAPHLALPAQAGDWKGRDVKVDAVVYEILHPDALVQKRYTLQLPGDTSQGDTSQGDTSQGDTSQGDTSQSDTSQGDTSSTRNGVPPNGAPPITATVLVIYSRDPQGLHSPVTCMRAQGWMISNEENRVVGRGDEQLSVNVLTGEQREQQTQLAYCFSDSSHAASGRIATYAKMIAARFLRRRIGAVEIQFAYDARSKQANGDFSPQLSRLMIDVSRDVRRSLASESVQKG